MEKEEEEEEEVDVEEQASRFLGKVRNWSSTDLSIWTSVGRLEETRTQGSIQ